MTLGMVFLTELEVSEARRGWDGWVKCVRVFGFVSDGRRRLGSDSSHSALTTIGASERRLQTDDRVATLVKYAVKFKLFCTLLPNWKER